MYNDSMNRKVSENNSFFETQNRNDINFSEIFNILLRYKRLIISITGLTFILSILYAITAKRIWEGQFQIVISNKSQSSGLSSLLSSEINNIGSLIGGGSTPDKLKTEVEILKSPSVLMPIFEYVKNQKKIIDSKSDISFSKWKKNFKIDLQRNTSILDVEYKDTDKQLILTVLSKISSTYVYFRVIKYSKARTLSNE